MSPNTKTPDTESSSPATELIDAMQSGEHTALSAVQKFVQAVDEALPTLEPNDQNARRKVLDSAFKMVDELVTSSNDFARHMVRSSERAFQSE